MLHIYTTEKIFLQKTAPSSTQPEGRYKDVYLFMSTKTDNQLTQRYSGFNTYDIAVHLEPVGDYFGYAWMKIRLHLHLTYVKLASVFRLSKVI